jgi:hypothetical protein
MHGHLIAFGATLATVAVMMPSAGASRGRDWSEPVNVGPMINTGYDETSPAISKDGRALYFQSSRPGGIGTSCDLWVAQREGVHQEWDWPENLGPVVNTETCENSVSLSRDEHHLFFSRPPGDIWVSYRRDVRDHFGWEVPVRLGAAINTDTAAESTGRQFVSLRHGISQLYFFSTRPGGPGSADIYVADAFGAPRLVQELSSPDLDAGAVLSRNGLEVFFHSTRPGGTGVRDLWTATRNSVFDSWSSPENIGSVVNSTRDELVPALSSDDDTLFFGSNRPTGFGLSDIYVTTRARHGGH